MIKKSLLSILSVLTLTAFSQESRSVGTATPAAGEPLSNDSLTKELMALKKEVSGIKNMKISGWIQTQMQFADSNGVANFDGGTFAPASDKRFMIRRGRVKFTYTAKNAVAVMQINGTERGINLTEIYGIYTLPKFKWLSLSTGIMNRPFGFEIDQSSMVRESPERSRYTQILMPNERDLGAKIIFAPTKDSKLFGLRLDAGFYNGQGVNVPGTTTTSGYPANTYPTLGVNEFDFGKDFIGRLTYYKDVNEKIRFGLGASHYNGGIINSTNKIYNKIEKDTNGVMQWKLADTTNALYKGKLSARIYTGFEAFFSIKSIIGTTILRGEYIMGTQPGSSSSSASPATLPTGDTYIRTFNGAYAYFIQRIAKTKHEVVVKYQWYDPNTKVSGAEILGPAKNKFTSADVKYTELGFGYNYYFDEHVKLMVFYNMLTNEVSGDAKTALNGFQKDIKDNILTIRVQYRF